MCACIHANTYAHTMQMSPELARKFGASSVQSSNTLDGVLRLTARNPVCVYLPIRMYVCMYVCMYTLFKQQPRNIHICHNYVRHI